MDGISETLIKQAASEGVGVATIVLVLFLLTVIGLLWRKIGKQEEQHAADRADERSRHAIEMAAERKLNQELQEARLTELRNAIDAVKRVTSTVETALTLLQGRAN